MDRFHFRPRRQREHLIMHPDGTGVKQSEGSTTTSLHQAGPPREVHFCFESAIGIGSSEIWMYHMDGGTGVQITNPSLPKPRKDRRPNAMVW